MSTPRKKTSTLCGLFLLPFALLSICATQAPLAAAETPPPLLWQVPEDKDGGSGAGSLSNPLALAASPVDGHVFVADAFNSRIGEFDAWGEFVKAFGWGVRDGSPELQTCTEQTGCQAGIAGAGPGQLNAPSAIAVDASGSIFVYDFESLRVTKYSAAGQFLLTFGGEVDKTTGADICTASDVAGGDDCGAGVAGSDPGSFQFSSVLDLIDVGPDGDLYVGDKGRVQVFGANGGFKAQIPFSGELSALAGARVLSLAADPVSGDIYIAATPNIHEAVHVYRITSSGELVGIVEGTIEFEGKPKTVPEDPAGLAVDGEGNLFMVDHRLDALTDSTALFPPFEIDKFDTNGNCLICGQRFVQPDRRLIGGPMLKAIATSSACEIPGGDLYVGFLGGDNPSGAAYVQSYGAPPNDVVNCPPPTRPPAIEDQYASKVGTEAAEVVARINPRFWPDTTYYVQYGPQACLDSGWTSGCSTAPGPPGETLTDKVSNVSVATEGVDLEGLEPDTTYHYRFVAQSSGGGPVYGVGGTVGSPGQSASFHTMPLPLPEQTGCLNQSLRTGPSARLADCRAYEMVSPADKAGGDIATGNSLITDPAALYLSSEDGDRSTYSSQAAFAGALSAPYTSQYLARRDAGSGWQTEPISPPRGELFHDAGLTPLYELDLQYKLFSPDLGEAWLMQEADPPLDGCGVPGHINLYRRDNSSGAYEAITTVAPPNTTATTFGPEVQGVSADGTRTIFRANDQLPVSGPVPPADISGFQLYEHIAEPGGCGQTRLVSVLPDGSANPTEAMAGASLSSTAAYFWESREFNVQNAISADGSKIYWTAADNGAGTGLLYVRSNGTQTFAVSKGAASFQAASSTGTIAYYTEAANLYRFTLGNKKSTLVAGEVLGVVAVSKDAQRAYFVSTEALGGTAVAGKPNLYLYSGGVATFIATLASEDVKPDVRFRLSQPRLTRRLAQISADGAHLLFASYTALTGFDNRDPSGVPASEVFLYDAEGGQLHCVSCAMTGVSPSGLEERTNITSWIRSAQVPTWENQFHAPRVISSDGSRVFFESYEPLVPGDHNEAQDVYEWERAESKAQCEAVGAELYNPEAGGCISLISSGKGEEDSFFADASADGANAFFRTGDSLVGTDPGWIDLYDARVGGGFPEPEPGCGESCPQPPPPTPPGADPAPKSATAGPEGPPPPDCAPLKARAKALSKRAKALRAKARKAAPARARGLKAKAKKLEKKANKTKQKARSCARAG